MACSASHTLVSSRIGSKTDITWPQTLYLPSFVSDGLFLLDRQRKDELEQRMSALQESRRELMVQLEGLMKLLKVRAGAHSRSPLAAHCLVPHPPPGQLGPPTHCDVGTGGGWRLTHCYLDPVSR